MALVLINGAADIISSHLVERLFNPGYQGKVLDNSGRFYPSG
jgi:nucleoside-diphosphate-sugar epimerase